MARRGWLALALLGVAALGSYGRTAPLPDVATPVPTAERPRATVPRVAAEVFARTAGYSEPVLSPRGDRLLTRGSADGRERVTLHDLETGRSRALPLPDEAEIAWYDWAGNDRALVSLGWSMHWGGEDVYATRLAVFDLSSGSVRVIGDRRAGPEGDDVLYVDPSGGWLLLSLQERVDRYPAVVRVDLATGAQSVVVEPHKHVWDWYADDAGAVRVGVAYEDDGWSMLYRRDAREPFQQSRPVSYDEDDGSFDVIGVVQGSDQGYVLSDAPTGRYALHRFDFARHALGEQLFASDTNDVDDYQLSRDGRRVVAAYYTDERARVHWFDADMQRRQAELERRFPGKEVWFVSEDDALDRFVLWIGGANDPGDYWLYALPADRLTHLASLNDRLDPAVLADTQYVRYTARDGLEISAYLTLPRGREPRALPLVVVPHGGPYFVRDELGYDPEVQFLANRGYAVLQPNYRGSSGYGREFASRGEGQWGRAMQDDLDDGVAWLEARGTVDPKRVAIYGSSYGGYAALWGATRNPDLYRCAASYAGVADVARHLRYQSAHLDGGERADWQATVRGDRRFDLRRVSPLAQVRKLRVPVLVGHGEADETVPFKQSDLYRAALEREHKPHEFVAYPGEGHGLNDPDDFRDWLERLEAFFGQCNPPD